MDHGLDRPAQLRPRAWVGAGGSRDDQAEHEDRRNRADQHLFDGGRRQQGSQAGVAEGDQGGQDVLGQVGQQQRGQRPGRPRATDRSV